MSKRVLVPLDGSTRSERVLPLAARLAESDGTVVLLRVAHPESGSQRGPGEHWPATVDVDCNEGFIYLATIGKDQSLNSVTAQIDVRTGPVAETIVAAAGDQHVDLIVMNSHGTAGLPRRVSGRVAEEVVRLSSVPVVVVREPGARPVVPRPRAERPLRMLVALDGSPLAETAILPAAECIAALAAPTRAELHLLRALGTSRFWHRDDIASDEAGDYIPPSDKESRTEWVRSALGALATDLATGPLANMNLAVTWSVALARDAAEAIIRAAEEGDTSHGGGPVGGADMIALATHARAGLARWALGSVTDKVLQSTRVPVLVVHRAQGAARETAVRTGPRDVPDGFPPLL